MRVSRFFAAFLIGLAIAQSGCSAFSRNKDSSTEIAEPEARSLGDAPSWNKDVEDPYAFVGEAARKNRRLEIEPDPWYRNWFMSAEARNIERSLGIVDD